MGMTQQNRERGVRSLLDAPANLLEPMSSDLSRKLVDCCSFKGRDSESLPPSVRRNFYLTVFLERACDWSGVKLTVPLLMFLSFMIHSVQSAILWAFTLHLIYNKIGKTIDIKDFVNAFPFGFPNEKAIAEIWVLQKFPEAPCHNMLDNRASWV